MSTLITRLIGDDTVHELVRREDGQDVLRTFVHEADMDRELTPEKAMEWCDHVLSAGGTVNHRVTGWAARNTAQSSPRPSAAPPERTHP